MKKAKKNGRNVFGQKCATKIVVITRENAKNQLEKIVDNVMSPSGPNVEYDLDMSQLTYEEQIAVNEQLNRMMRVRSALMYGAWRCS